MNNWRVLQGYKVQPVKKNHNRGMKSICKWWFMSLKISTSQLLGGVPHALQYCSPLPFLDPKPLMAIVPHCQCHLHQNPLPFKKAIWRNRYLEGVYSDHSRISWSRIANSASEVSLLEEYCLCEGGEGLLVDHEWEDGWSGCLLFQMFQLRCNLYCHLNEQKHGRYNGPKCLISKKFGDKKTKSSHWSNIMETQLIELKQMI